MRDLPNLLLRADGDPRMGAGHVMRCLALAQAWQDAGGAAAFALAAGAPALEARLASERLEVCRIHAPAGSAEDAAEVARLAADRGARWVVLDGYHFAADYQLEVKKSGVRLLAIDDFGAAGRYAADVILNQDLHASDMLYTQRAAASQLLLGPRYILLRREFHPYRTLRREIPKVGRKVLVTLGGSDPDNVTLRAIQALLQVGRGTVEAVVVGGGLNPHIAELRAALQGAEDFIHLRHDVTDMAALMAWADVAITAGGCTTWERALLGLASLIVVLADNQAASAAACEATGLGKNLGWHGKVTVETLAAALDELLHDASARAAAAAAGAGLVDGHGVERVTRTLLGRELWVRLAGQADARILWEWANDPAARHFAFHSAPILWPEHEAWFARKLTEAGCRILIAVDAAETPCGQIRFDQLAPGEFEVSVSLDLRRRGEGLGTELICVGTEHLRREAGTCRVHAFINPVNQASLRAFQRAGYSVVGEETVYQQSAIHMVS